MKINLKTIRIGTTELPTSIEPPFTWWIRRRSADTKGAASCGSWRDGHVTSWF